MTKTAEKRYIVEAPTQNGTYYQQLGWRCIDTKPVAPEFRTVASGDKRTVQRWARQLNAR